MLRPAERVRLLAQADWVELEYQQVLGRAGEQLAYVYFPTNSMISLLSNLEGVRTFEAGQIGFEGMLGVGGGLGVSALAFDAVVSGAGQAWRISSSVWRRRCMASRSLSLLMTRYLYAELSQMGAMVACSRFHSIEQRLARFLLMSETRLRSPDIQMTHEGLALILGVRRAGVTLAAGELQDKGVIRYTRGDILVLDQGALLAASCSCYAQDLSTYERVMSDVVL